MEQLESQLGAVDVELDDALLDRIDEIVPPGTNFSRADAGWTPPALADAGAAPSLTSLTAARRRAARAPAG